MKSIITSNEYSEYISKHIKEYSDYSSNNNTIGISGSCGASGICGPTGTSGSCGSYGISGKTYKEEKLPILEINEFLSYDKIIKPKSQTSNWFESYSNMHSLYE